MVRHTNISFQEILYNTFCLEPQVGISTIFSPGKIAPFSLWAPLFFSLSLLCRQCTFIMKIAIFTKLSQIIFFAQN
jgi:hypothetical protein